MNRPVFWLVLCADRPERVFPCNLDDPADAAELDRLYADESVQLRRVPLHAASKQGARS